MEGPSEILKENVEVVCSCGGMIDREDIGMTELKSPKSQGGVLNR